MEENKGRLEFVDILKGIAILMVVIVHSSQKIVGMHDTIYKAAALGETGCQLFFVLSGYLLTYSVNRKQISLKEFYKKRWMSIAPPYYIAVVFWSVVGYLQYRFQISGGFGYNGSIREILCNLFLLNGLFSEGNNNIVPGGWYIGALVILYALYPLVHQITVSLYRKSKVLLSGFYLVLYAVSEIAVYLNRTGRFTSLVLNANCFLHQLSCLVMGISVFYVLRDYREMLVRHKKKAMTCMILLLPLQITAYYCGTVPMRNFASGLLFSSLFINCDLFSDRTVNCNISRKLKKMGQVSYEIYFIHFVFAWYIMPFIQRLIGNVMVSFAACDLYYVISICLCLPVMNLLASVYHRRWIEVRDRLHTFVIQCRRNVNRLHRENYDLRKE